MKSINFQRNKSMIRVVNEKSKAGKRRNWDRIMYLCLLSVFLIFIAYYLITKFAYVHANGHVIIESMHIRLTNDARLLRLQVCEGDSIRKNDTLFSYATDPEDQVDGNVNDTGTLNINSSAPNSWTEREAHSMLKKIKLNQVSQAQNNHLIQSYEAQIKPLTNEVILDVMPRSRLDYLKNEILKLKSENKRLNAENAELETMITGLGMRVDETVTIAGGTFAGSDSGDDTERLTFSDETLSVPKYFKAPISGVITRIFIHNFETALKSEDILTIHQTHPAFIKAYFDQKDLRHFKVGDVFHIEFPDGTSSRGILRRFYIATYALPDEFQKKYEPVTRSVAADIYPLDSSEMSKWIAFYKMSVDITKLKF